MATRTWRTPAVMSCVGSKPTQPSSGSSTSSQAWVAIALSAGSSAAAARGDVAAHVAARQPEPAQRRQHHVGEVLAHAAAGGERLVDRRVHARGVGSVLETAVHGVHHRARRGEWIGLPRRHRPQRLDKGQQRRRPGGEVARLAEVPVVPAGVPAVHGGPRRLGQPLGGSANASTCTCARAVITSSAWRRGMSKWCTQLPRKSR